MNKNYPKFIIILLMLLIQKTVGQEKFTAGYIEKKNGDTIQGYIDFENSINTPNKIGFKNFNDENIHYYTPKNIASFKLNNDIYKSAIIETNSDTTAVFLFTITEGKKSLYSYAEPNKSIQFYIKQNDKYLLLVFKKGSEEIVENEKFKGQLVYYLNDCPSINSTILSASYNSSSLGNVFNKYYNCTESVPDYKKNTKVKLDLGIIAGVSMTSLKFKENDFLPYLNEKFETSTDFTAGVFFDISLSEKEKKWSFYNEIQYYSYNTSNYYKTTENENIYRITNTKIGHSFIKLNNLARYNFPVGKQSMYLNAGITNGFVIREENYKKVENNIYSNQTIIIGSAVPFPKKNEFGFIVGLGMKFNKFLIDARYEITNGISGESPNSTLNKLYLLIGYKL